MLPTADLGKSCVGRGQRGGLQLARPSASPRGLTTSLVDNGSKSTMHICNLQTLGPVAFSALRGKMHFLCLLSGGCRSGHSRRLVEREGKVSDPQRTSRLSHKRWLIHWAPRL